MALNINALKEEALIELAPRILPVTRFIDFVRGCLKDGMDVIGVDTLADWMLNVPLMYGELRCIEADYLYIVDSYDAEIERVKAEAQTSKGIDVKITEARAQASLLVNDFQVRQLVAKFMARHVNAMWSQLEMLIFSIRSLFDSKNPKVKNDI